MIRGLNEVMNSTVKIVGTLLWFGFQFMPKITVILLHILSWCCQRGGSSGGNCSSSRGAVARHAFAAQLSRRLFIAPMPPLVCAAPLLSRHHRCLCSPAIAPLSSRRCLGAVVAALLSLAVAVPSLLRRCCRAAVATPLSRRWCRRVQPHLPRHRRSIFATPFVFSLHKEKR